ncbi:amidase family protein [Geomicrobium sp. JCM 19039]|uniref:amidase family protein n=1 Tax=Geomicrobium sp. JCM 19039 TaxID=1460636 RepID=UPI00045F419A|nr:amidase family protein [Geomicrobium sp. JCM 19039]GAK10562.1 amidase [Geomicrobium sp. JCM 19039]
MLANYWHEETTIHDIHEAFRVGTLTAQKLTMYYMERIALFDQDGPCINAVLDIAPDAITIAKTLDQKFKQSGLTGPLHGIPILVKDNIQTGDTLSTSAGTTALKDWKAANDAFLVKKLRNAGAIILGKANMTELAHRIGKEGMPNSFSSRAGLVLAPYAPETFDVGGSSSGSAAAITSNFAAVSIGTETSGSLLNPAARNALVTIKPTFGLVSRSGIIPLSYSQDVAGPLTRTVADAAIVLDTIAGVDVDDPTTHGVPGSPTKYSEHLDEDGLKDKRIGIYRGAIPEDMTPHVNDALYESIVQTVKSRGAEIVENIDIPDIHKQIPSLLRYEIKHALTTFFQTATPQTNFQNFDELLAYYFEHASEQPYGFDSLLSGTDRKEALANREWLLQKIKNEGLHDEESIENTLTHYNLDAILFPSATGFAVGARAGLPSIAIPAGFMPNGQPFGVTFTGRAFHERTLIEIGSSLEQATRLRKPPVFS